MYVEVMPTGGKLFRLKHRFGGKENRLALGAFPDVSLKLARERRDEAGALLASGVDPSATRKAEKEERAANTARAANTFEAVVSEWLANGAREWVPRHAVRVTRLFERDLVPWLGPIPKAEVTAADLLSVLRRIDERGANDTAHRARQALGQVFNFAIPTGRASGDPSAALKGALPREKGKHFAAVTEPAKLGPLLRSLYSYEGAHPTRCALRLAPLVFLRPGELRQGEWPEFDFEQALWTVPAERMKGRRKGDPDHIVPLSRQALAILRELHHLTGHGRFIFPSAKGGYRPMSDGTVNNAMRSMSIPKEVMTGHGFRATARTILDEVLHIQEQGPDVLTPEQMRARLRRAAENQPEDVYGAGLPKGHVASVLRGEAEPLPDLLALLELRTTSGGYASTLPEEPEEPFLPTWPDGRPVTREDEAEVNRCVRDALGQDGRPWREQCAKHYDLSRLLFYALVNAGAREYGEEMDREECSLAFLAGAAWERRRREPDTAV